jgi:hypothetical protein
LRSDDESGGDFDVFFTKDIGGKECSEGSEGSEELMLRMENRPYGDRRSAVTGDCVLGTRDFRLL